MVKEAWKADRISVSFGAQVALENVSAGGFPHEIVALAGQNGAGKSTLVKVLSGVLPAGTYSGDITVGDTVRRFRDTAEAASAGVVMVPQELAIVPHLSVASNVYLGRELTRWGLIDETKMERQAQQTLDYFGVDIDPSQEAGSLGIPQQQIVEIAKALSQDASVLILDEPTAALTTTEASHLFDRLRQLAEQGLSIVYITHRLDELGALADRVIVLRDGRVELDTTMGEVGPHDVVTAMVGRELEEVLATSHGLGDSEIVLSLDDWSVEPRNRRGPRVRDISMQIRAGEVLGIYGSIGAGRTELLRSIVGAYDGHVSGNLTLHGIPEVFNSPYEALSKGVVYISEDRKGLGIQPFMNVQDNITLSNLDELTGVFGFLDEHSEGSAANRAIASMGIRARPSQSITSLSGGNQQKSLLARGLMAAPNVLLLDEPTRGIDVGAKAEIVVTLERLADRGIAVVIVSSEAEDLLSVDRILILRSGRIVAERTPNSTSVDELVRIATGAAAS